jgi:hypothetical protein
MLAPFGSTQGYRASLLAVADVRPRTLSRAVTRRPPAPLYSRKSAATVVESVDADVNVMTCLQFVFRVNIMMELWTAGVAQLVEHLICNQRVGGSNPFASSTVGQRAGGNWTSGRVREEVHRCEAATQVAACLSGNRSAGKWSFRSGSERWSVCVFGIRTGG